MKEKNIELTKKIIMFVLFGAYWLFVLLQFVTGEMVNKEKTLFILLQIIIFLPMTICVTFRFDVFAIFMLIVYEIVIAFTGLYASISYFKVNDYIFESIISLIQVALAIVSEICLIRYIANKEVKNVMKLIVFGLGLVRAVLTILGFLKSTNIATSANDVYTFINTTLIVILLYMYVAMFPKKEIKIFKD